jgi:hypothetical protein
MATSTSHSGRVVRISSNGGNGDEDLSHELFAVAIDDDQGALDAFHQQFAAFAGAEIIGPLRAATIVLLKLTDGQATPL